jgi:Na+/H+-dicarboxylate symporter
VPRYALHPGWFCCPGLFTHPRSLMWSDGRMKIWVCGATGIATLCIALGLILVGFLQPGVTCAEDDSAAGCASTPLHSGMLVSGVVLVPTSILFLVRAGKRDRLAP